MPERQRRFKARDAEAATLEPPLFDPPLFDSAGETGSEHTDTSSHGFQFSNVQVFDPERPPDSPLERVRSQVGAQTGFDLGAVQVHSASESLRASPLEGLTVGHEVHLAPSWQPDGQGLQVLAHEFAHTVQQSTGAQFGSSLEHLEGEAERVSAQALSRPDARVAAQPPLPAAAQPVAQAFDPRYHRTSIVNALSDPMPKSMPNADMAPGFTAEEIGAIYAANWERDLSQAHPSLGNVILAWKQVKLAAAAPERDQGAISSAEAGFNASVESVINAVNSEGVDKFMLARSYGGYAFWEHMDNPGGDINAELTKRLEGEMELKPDQDVKLQLKAYTGGLPPHMFVAREHIKELLFNAVTTAHPDFEMTGSAREAHDRSESRTAVLRSQGLNSADDHDQDPAKHTTVSDAGASTQPIQAEVTSEVRSRALVPAGSGQRFDPAAYVALGRASHALEDFWSHSNFAEMAIGEAHWDTGVAASGRDNALTTSTFGATDSSHAVAHKIRAAADEIQAEFDLVQHALGRGAKLPDQQQVTVGDESTPTPEPGEDEHGAFGHGMAALGEESLFDEFIRNPATAGAGVGGVIGHYSVGPFGTLGLTPVGGGIAGGVTGALGGAAGGWHAGHSLLGNNWAGDIAGGIFGSLGGALGAITGTASGAVGGLVGGLSTAFSSQPDVATAGIQGASVFGAGNLAHVATSLALANSHAGISMLRAVAESLEESTRQKQKDANDYASHTVLAKDQPGHDREDRPTDTPETKQDHLADALKTKKFELAHALSVAADQRIIGRANRALTAATAVAAQAELEAINTDLNGLVSAPTSSHPLWSIVEAHRGEVENALNNLHGKPAGL